MSDQVTTYLRKQKASAKDDVADNWHKLEDLHAKKLDFAFQLFLNPVSGFGIL